MCVKALRTLCKIGCSKLGSPLLNLVKIEVLLDMLKSILTFQKNIHLKIEGLYAEI